MNIFQELFRTLVYEPQLNLLNLFYNLTGREIGLSFILLAIAVNLMILPIYAKSYINMQKTRILQPQIQEIQAKFRKDPQLLIQKMTEFNKKHNISSGYVFLVLIVQIFFLSGLYVVINDVVQGKTLTGLYKLFWSDTTVSFTNNGQTLAFNFIDIGASAKDYLWIPLISLVFSYLYGMYTFRWSPKPNLPKPKPRKKDDKEPLIDPEMMQKNMEFQSIYIMPVMLFLLQYAWPTGLNIYFATSSVISLVRQIFLTNFYTSHTDKLLADIAESDPSSRDNNPDNNLTNTGRADQLASDKVVAEVVVKPKNTQNKKKKKK